MKICYLCADPGIPLYGRKGCSTHVRETCTALLRAGHEVKVICSNVEGDTGGERVEASPVAAPTSKKLGFDFRHILLDRRMGAELERVIADWKPDALYERYSLYSRAGCKAAQRHGLPRLLEVNAFLTKEQKDRIRMLWLARRIERSTIGGARKVIVVSEPLRKEIHELGVPMADIAKMPMAVNLEKFSPGLDAAGLRRRFDLEGRLVIGYVGTLAGWHGIRLMYDLAEKLKALGAPPFAFLIVGGEGDKLEMHRRKSREAGLERELLFVGSAPHQEIPQYLRAMDMALVPDMTYWSSPAKLFEYQACGLPVLAPDYPAIPEVLTHEVEGFIFPKQDIDAMARDAMRLLTDEELRRRMSAAARARAEREHSWDRNAEEILKLFGELGAPV